VDNKLWHYQTKEDSDLAVVAASTEEDLFPGKKPNTALITTLGFHKYA
jgi:hypothetical protein